MSGTFRLGVVLRLREMAEESARVQLGHALRAYHDAVAAVRKLTDELEHERTRFGRLQRRTQSNAGDLADAAEAVAMAERSVATGESQLESAARFMLEARQQLAEARRRREVVERLRDRAIAAEALRVERREEAELSELATTRHVWRDAEGLR